MTENHGTSSILFDFDAEILVASDEDDVYVPVVWNGRELGTGPDLNEEEIDWLLNVAIANIKRVYGRKVRNTGTTVVTLDTVSNPAAVIQTPSAPADGVLAIKPQNREAFYISDISYFEEEGMYELEPFVLVHEDGEDSMPIYVGGVVVDDGHSWPSEDIETLGEEMALTVSYYYGVNAHYLSNNEVSDVSSVPVPSNVVEV